MSNGTTYKRCGCYHTETRRRIGQQCPKLRRGNSWNPHHGTWYLQIDLPPTIDGRRRIVRLGGYGNQTDADTRLAAIREALTVADASDPTEQAQVADIIEAACKARHPVPSAAQIRQLLHLDRTGTSLPTTAEFLTEWLAGRKALRAGTRRTYESHLARYLIPYLGNVRIDKLRANHISAMFDAIAERSNLAAELRASADPVERRRANGMYVIKTATMHRVRATLRTALNAAARERLIETNPAIHVELPSMKRPKALVWTDERVKRWRRTGQTPSPVMVWTPAQTGAFLDHTHDVDDRLYALYHLVAYRGLRRGEACGLHWADVDLAGKTIAVRWQLTQLGWETHLTAPKTDSSDAVVALDAETATILTAHRRRQHRERIATGPDWDDTGLVFTTPTGAKLHPANVTDHFRELTQQADLPPIRLHDLRHGAATLALAAGVDMKAVQAMLRHSSITITADTYTSVLPELAHDAAERAAAIVPRRDRRRAS